MVRRDVRTMKDGQEGGKKWRNVSGEEGDTARGDERREMRAERRWAAKGWRGAFSGEESGLS